MNKFIKIGVATISLAALAGCSTFGIGSKDEQTQPAASTDTVTKLDTSSDTGVKPVAQAAQPTAKVSLKQKQNKLVATMYTTYNGNPKGSVKLAWTAPKNSGCYNTSFPIAKYSEKNDKTWASVSLKHGNKYCAGKWTANVMFDGKVIATDSINVAGIAKKAAPVAAKKTVAPATTAVVSSESTAK